MLEIIKIGFNIRDRQMLQYVFANHQIGIWQIAQVT
jgi:hypothetical protein